MELMAAVMQHPEGVATAAAGMPAAASTAGGSVAEPGPLGAAPHMIRGQLSSFSQLCLTGELVCNEWQVLQHLFWILPSITHRSWHLPQLSESTLDLPSYKLQPPIFDASEIHGRCRASIPTVHSMLSNRD